METVRVALAQINPTVGDLSGNRSKIVDFILRARRSKADIVVFPELALTGYPPEDLLLKKHFIDDNLRQLKYVIQETKGIVAIIGFADRDKRNRVYNAAAIACKGKLECAYHKNELPNYSVFDEKRYFYPGNDTGVFSLGKLIFGVNICEDIWKEKSIAHKQAQMGASLIINISASPYYAGKRSQRYDMLRRRCRETRAYICYNNLIGGQDELVFDGASVIFDPQGKVCIKGRQFEEDFIVYDFLPKKSKSCSESREIKSLGNLKKINKPSVVRRSVKQLDKIAETYGALVLATADYVKKNGFEKTVIGLSGGIDSALTAAIACDAIGNRNVIGITMPSGYSSAGTQADAKKLAENLGIKFIAVPINSIFDAYLKSLGSEFKGLPHDIAEENIQARIRGNILMAFSNKFGWLVLTTGNKSEASVGYCTLYGDTAGGFSVIKDVPKTLVYKLSRFVNKIKRRHVIPEAIFTRAPSAELKENQADQDTLPPYSLLDIILQKYVEEDNGFDKIVSTGRIEADIVKDIIRKVDRNEYKRRQSPLGIKITPKAFGKDRRLPVTNKYEQF